jgi:integrase
VKPVLKGVHFVSSKRKHRPIQWYVYAWRGGPLIMQVRGGPKPALTPEALTKFQAAHEARKTNSTDTISGLASAWRQSALWGKLAASTRKQWSYVLADIEEKWGEVPIALFEDIRVKAKIIAWRDLVADKPRKAGYRIQVLSALLSHGVLIGALAKNIASGIPGLYKGGNRQTIVWTPEEIEVWQSAPEQVRDAVNLARLTGLRRADLIAIPWSAVQQNAIVWHISKSGRQIVVAVPLIPALRDLLTELRTRQRANGVETILVNSLGKAWTPDGLGTSMRDARDKLGLPDKHLHDFRGTYCTELCKAGLTDEQVAGIMGWSEQQVRTIRRLYVDDAAITMAIGARLAGSAM